MSLYTCPVCYTRFEGKGPLIPAHVDPYPMDARSFGRCSGTGKLAVPQPKDPDHV